MEFEGQMTDPELRMECLNQATIVVLPGMPVESYINMAEKFFAYIKEGPTNGS